MLCIHTEKNVSNLSKDNQCCHNGFPNLCIGFLILSFVQDVTPHKLKSNSYVLPSEIFFSSIKDVCEGSHCLRWYGKEADGI